LTVSRRMPVARSMRRSGHPRRPSATTCSWRCVSKTFPMATEEHKPLVAVNVSVDGSQEMAGFEVLINGRVLVATEGNGERGGIDAGRGVAEVRAWRQQELTRFWPAVWRRGVLPAAFALTSAWAAGAGYAWVTRPYSGELAQLRSRTE